jgi:FkbM family methyltransferase
MNLPDSSSPLGRALRIPLRLVPSNAPVRILQGPLRGKKKWIAGSSLHGCWLGTFERRKQVAFMSSVKPGNVVYDLGANVGFYSLLASLLVGKEGRVIAFEPVPRNVSYLRKHLQLNRVTNCSVFECAVSDTNGRARFDFSRSHSTGRLTKDRSGDITVPTVMLDGLFRQGEIPAPHIVKCDIEGGEHAALSGALEVLTTCRPILFLATHGAEVHRKCCDLLRNAGYRLKSLEGSPIEMITSMQSGASSERWELFAEPHEMASRPEAAVGKGA